MYKQIDIISNRWFTPTNEVNLCGHGTLATAAALLHYGNKNERLRFRTLSGDLEVESRNGTLFMKFPSYPPRSLTEAENISLRETIKHFGLEDKVQEMVISPGK